MASNYSIKALDETGLKQLKTLVNNEEEYDKLLKNEILVALKGDKAVGFIAFKLSSKDLNVVYLNIQSEAENRGILNGLLYKIEQTASLNKLKVLIPNPLVPNLVSKGYKLIGNNWEKAL